MTPSQVTPEDRARAQLRKAAKQFTGVCLASEQVGNLIHIAEKELLRAAIAYAKTQEQKQ